MPSTKTKTSTSARLPSFDELLASITRPSSPPHEISISRTTTPIIPFAPPRKTPTPPPTSPKTGLENLERTPSTPPIVLPCGMSSPLLAPPPGRLRARAATAPSLFVRPSLDEHKSPQGHELVPRYAPHGHALGLAPSLSCEHHHDRVREIKEGDGDLHLDDAVSPMFLPERARPHLHGRNFSTSSIPIPLPHHTSPPSQTRPRHPSRDPISPSRTPTSTASASASPSRSYSFGSRSHSPLSTCDPLTPRSIHMSFEERLEAREKEWDWRGMGRERSGTGSTDGGMKIPTLPKMR